MKQKSILGIIVLLLVIVGLFGVVKGTAAKPDKFVITLPNTVGTLEFENTQPRTGLSSLSY